MSRPLFYLDALPGEGATVVLDGDEGFHATTVRRIRVGEEIDLGDGRGHVARVVVGAVEKGRLSARVLEVRTASPPVPAVTVVQALPKADRAELAVELAVEAGADALVPWQAGRCVARWDGPAKQEKGLRRWQAVARAAARQSRRPHLPSVSPPLGTPALVDEIARSPLTLVLHEAAADSLLDVAFGGFDRLTIVVGPEGGIGDDELAQLTGAGARAVRLGPTVLRTSTAAAVTLGTLGALTERWRR